MKIICPVWFAATLALSLPAAAQGTEVSLGGLVHDTSLPVEVTSDSLSVFDADGRAEFDGNVLVVQGPMRLTAAKMLVMYEENGAEGGTQIREMVASGGVTFVNGPDAAESREATYSPEAGTLVMVGDVLLTQEATAISGARLTVDLATGTGVMDGRVRTTFQAGGN